MISGADMLTDKNPFSDLKDTINQIAFVPDEQLNALLPLTSKISYRKDEYFTKAGDNQLYIGYIIDGIFRLYYVDLNGKEYTKNFFIKNNFVAAYNALLQEKPSNLYIQALANAEVLLINYRESLKLLDSHLGWQIFFRKITEQVYLQKENRESDLLFYDAATRYLRFKEEFPDLDKRIKQCYIASFLGMSPETLCRIKNKKVDNCQ